jgi:hypothetical protein
MVAWKRRAARWKGESVADVDLLDVLTLGPPNDTVNINTST